MPNEFNDLIEKLKAFTVGIVNLNWTDQELHHLSVHVFK